MSATTSVNCTECEDTAASVRCNECGDLFCALCFQWQHRTGTRATHSTTPLPSATQGVEAGTTRQFMQQIEKKAKTSESDEKRGVEGTTEAAAVPKVGQYQGPPISQRCRYIPLRISPEERVLLRLLEGALDVSEYTDKVDITNSYGFGWGSTKSKSETIREELDDMFSLCAGLQVCSNFRLGQQLVQDRDHNENAHFFQKVFEVGRRYKITNPLKMRSTYGKLMYLMQDAEQPHILNFSTYADIQTVYSMLEACDAIALLDDPRVVTATAEIESTTGSREALAALVGAKNEASAALCAEYANKRLTEDMIQRSLYSIADNNSFLASNCAPVDRMLALLKENFSPDAPVSRRHSLALQFGVGGAKLNHDHHTQYTFVLQSLLLWREVLNDFFYLWQMAETDLLTNAYRLWNTGQGLNRVQSAPNIGGAMHKILRRVQEAAGQWVGLSVVHLGDRDVPNALIFIDKYTQVPRILGPIVQCVEGLERLCEDRGVKQLIEHTYGGVDNLRKDILVDFFKHGFDGSGSDGGSCIDGRLTSSWNWCSKIEKKDYYPIFLLSEFQGFDGDFRR